MKKPRRWLRRFVIAAAVVPLVLVAMRLWVVQGLFVPVRVSGDSMAPTLVGQHWQIACDDCGFPFEVARAEHNDETWAVCPNCGWRHNRLELAAEEPGERVLLGKLPLWLSPLGRWQVVALETPDRPGQLSVKRVVGLPGEAISIHAGDVYADGEIVRKSLAELRNVAVPVHFDSYRTTIGELPARWQPDTTPSPWRQVRGGYDCDSVDDQLAWLTYRHWSCQPPPGSRSEETPARDDYGYNQWLSRSLNEVSDLLLSAEVQLRGSGRLALLAHDGRERFEVELVIENGVAKRLHLIRGGERLVETSLEGSFREPARLELALCDRQVLLAVNRHTVFEYRYEASELPQAPSARPLAIGVAGLEAQVRQLAIYRDLYYLDPRGLPRDWEADSALAADEFLVLGDNCPVSRDSRQWPGSGVKQGQIVGRVWPPPRGPADR